MNGTRAYLIGLQLQTRASPEKAAAAQANLRRTARHDHISSADGSHQSYAGPDAGSDSMWSTSSAALMTHDSCIAGPIRASSSFTLIAHSERLDVRKQTPDLVQYLPRETALTYGISLHFSLTSVVASRVVLRERHQSDQCNIQDLIKHPGGLFCDQ